MSTRKERDSLGEVSVPKELLYGAQTARSLQNFPIGKEKIPQEVVVAFAYLKKAIAQVHKKKKLLSEEKAHWIEQACDEIIKGHLDEHFPLSVWQTGSGTQTNMNVNEVISNWVAARTGNPLGSKTPIHPNDDVNKSQSSNDTFPSAMHIAVLVHIHKKLLPALHLLKNTLEKKVKQFASIVKVGRTHLMDATPLTLGQEFSAYATQITDAIISIEKLIPVLSALAIGGTAVGTGLNSPDHFGEDVSDALSKLLNIPFTSAKNKFASLSSNDALLLISSECKRVATIYMKLANDIRLLASGPRCGLGELRLPSNEPGSSIMPGKVNPTQCEAMTMVAAQVMGNDLSITIGNAGGQLELNVFRPMIIYNLLQSLELLSDTASSFSLRCLEGMEANEIQIAYFLENTLMLATALNPVIGYDKATKIVQKAYTENITLRAANQALGFLSDEEFTRVIDPKNLTGSS